MLGRTVTTKNAKAAKGEATKSRILSAAYRVFAASGYDGASVRKISAESGVELSLILYHFKTKAGLYRAVFRTSTEAILQKRLVHVRQALKSQKKPNVEGVLRTFCESWFALSEGENRELAIIFARSILDQSDRQVALAKELTDAPTELFIDALKHAAPRASEADIHLCYHLFAGALIYFTLDNKRIVRLSGRSVGNTHNSMRKFAKMMARRLDGTDGWKQITGLRYSGERRAGRAVPV
jgi:AcrR family transcriptional regulator